MDPSELNAQAVEALKDDDIITSVVAEYSEKFPQVPHSPVTSTIVRNPDGLTAFALVGLQGCSQARTGGLSCPHEGGLNMSCERRPNLQVVRPLLHERDLYLTWSLKRSKAVNGGHL